MTDIAAPPAATARFDPQGHRLGPVGTLACQAGVALAIIWGFGAFGLFVLRPIFGLVPLLPVLGAFLLAPRSLVMRLPVSLSILMIFGLSISSIAWTIDPLATSAVLRSSIPSMVALILAAGILPLRDHTAAMVWAIRFCIAITVVALLIDSSTRSHITSDPAVPNYPGWHGYFIHKNAMTPFLVFSIPTILAFDKNFVARWASLVVIAGLLAGSSSVTGIFGGFLAGVMWVWLRIYQSQSREDLRTSTLFLAASMLGVMALLVGSFLSLATITSASGKDLTFSGRTDIWGAAVTAIEQRPLLGYGTGAMFWSNPVNQETDALWREVGFEAAHAHSGALDLMLQLGAVGLILFSGLWITTSRQGWSALRTRPLIGAWTVSILFAQMFMALSENLFFGIWIGVIGTMKVLMMRREEDLYPPRIRDMRRWSE